MFLPKVRDLSLIVLMFLVFIQLKHSCSYMTIDFVYFYITVNSLFWIHAFIFYDFPKGI